MSNTYWAKRIEEESEKAYKRKVVETNRALRAVYKEQSEELYKELLAIFSKIIKDSKDGKLYINDLYRTNKIYALIEEFNKCSRKIGGKQIKITEKALISIYDEAQKIVTDTLPKRIVYPSFSVPSAVDTKQVINQTWCVDGLNFSQRVWKNKEKLVTDLTRIVGDLIMRGKSPYQVAQGVVARLGVDESSAYRIARTETAHAQIVGQANKYKEYGFTHGRFHANDPCDECGELDGQLFTLDELKRMIPRHPNCECSFLLEVQEVLNKMSKIKINKRITLNNNSKTIPVNAKGIGNAVGTDAYIQIISLGDERGENAAPITLTATMDNGDESMPIGAIDMFDFTGYESMENKSVYLVPVTSFDTLTFTCEGEAELIVKVIVE